MNRIARLRFDHRTRECVQNTYYPQFACDFRGRPLIVMTLGKRAHHDQAESVRSVIKMIDLR